MKQWISVLLTSVMLLLVATTSVFAMAKSYVTPFNSYAPPVSNTGTNNLASANEYIIAESVLGVSVSYTPTLQFSYASWDFVKNDSRDAIYAQKIVKEELLKYSAANLAKIGLKKIYLVHHLRVDGTFRSGMPDGQFEDALYFDIDSKYFTSENGEYMRRTLHHELRHLADYNMHKTYRPQDVNWLNCNPKTTVYGNGGASMYADAAYAHAVHPKAGFVTGYATSGIDEDRAEVYAYYMTSLSNLNKTSQGDSYLNCKIAQTELFLSSL